MNDKYLIKNTTREEREKLILHAIGDDACAGCAGCDGVGSGDAYTTYLPYIEGKKELYEINAEFRGGTVR